MSTQIDVKLLKPSGTNGHSLVTVAGATVWGNDFIDQNKFTTGSFYSGSNVTNSEQAGSHVAVSTGSTTVRGLVTVQHSTDVNAATIFGQKSRGTRASPTTVANADGTLSIISGAYDGTNYLRSAQIQFSVDAAVSAGSASQQISFLTGTGNAPSTKITISGTIPTGQIGTVLVAAAVDFTSVIAIHALGIATAVSSAGDIRMRANSTLISARNAANNANNDILNSDGSNNLTFGNSAQCPTLGLSATTTVQFTVGGNNQALVNTSRFEITRPVELSWAGSVANPILIQQSASGADGQRLWIHAQSITGAGDHVGGTLALSGGSQVGTSVHGKVSIGINTDNTISNFQHMLEVGEVILNNRIIALCKTSAITSTQMPANTGDAVIYVANAQTNPSADAVTGHIYYSDSARPAWRFNGTNLRLDGTAATATAGAGTLPLTPEGFISITLNGTVRKIPYYPT